MTHDHHHDHDDHVGDDGLTPQQRQDRDHAASLAAPTRWPDSEALGVTLRFIPDHAQASDHSGVPITPQTDAGMPYRYKIRSVAGGEPGNWYASTPAEVLALVIDGYAPQRGATVEAERDRVQQRARFARGVIIQYVAQAILDGRLDDVDAQHWLRRSAMFDADTPVLSNAELEQWSHPELPLLLVAELYRGVTPPAGDKIWLHPSNEQQFCQELAGLGVVQLEENPYYTAAAPLTTRSAPAGD